MPCASAARAPTVSTLDTVFEALDIFDDVEVRPAQELTLSITGLGEDLPTDESNLAIRAARALQERIGTHLGADIRIIKRIPVAGEWRAVLRTPPARCWR